MNILKHMLRGSVGFSRAAAPWLLRPMPPSFWVKFGLEPLPQEQTLSQLVGYSMMLEQLGYKDDERIRPREFLKA